MWYFQNDEPSTASSGRRVCRSGGPLKQSNAARPRRIPPTPLEPLVLPGLPDCVDVIQQQVVRDAFQARKMLGDYKPMVKRGNKCAVHFVNFLPSLK